MNHKKYILSCAIFCSAFLGLNILSIVNYSIQKKEIIKKTTSFFDSAINELNNIDISNDFDCSYETQNILKEYAISMVYLKEISIIREDIIHCTAYGKSKVKILDSVKSSLNKKPTPSLFIYKSNLTQIGLYQIYIKKQDYTLIGTGNLKKLIDNIKTVNPNYDIEIANSECIDFFSCSEKTLKTNLQNYDISINEPPYNLNNILLLNLIISLSIGLFIFKLQPFLDRKINTYLFRKALSYDIKHKKLTLHFQPIINVKLNQVEKFETLIRWKSDKYGSVNADKIIQGCIENHEINRLTDLVFDLLAESTLFNSKACENIHFSVNIERESIIDTQYCTKLIDRIRLIGQRVDIEITENIEIQERYIASFKENIASIHHAGIDISVDDFGKAFASFDLLTNIKFDALKLDKAFVKDINTDPKKCKIIESIVNLSDELSFDIVVEGIEEQEQLDAFSNLRIYLIQGYFFAKPMPDKDALNWLESFNTQANTQS